MIQVTCAIKIHPGKAEEFRRQAAELVAMVRDKEAGCAPVYEYWHVNSDPMAVRITETYLGWHDLRTHSANVAASKPHFHALFDVVELSICGADAPGDLVEKYTGRYGPRVTFYSEIIAKL